MSFRRYNHKVYTISNNKIAMRNLNKHDKKLQDDDKITITISLVFIMQSYFAVPNQID